MVSLALSIISKMVDVVLNRVSSGMAGTYGVLVVDEHPICVTLELPWLDNLPFKSCIPEGSYVVDRFFSPKFNSVFLLHGVPDRSGILIHSGNTLRDTEGCILVGSSFTPTGVSDSLLALSKCRVCLPPRFDLTVRCSYGLA